MAELMGKRKTMPAKIEMIENEQSPGVMPGNEHLFLSQNTAVTPSIIAPIRILVKPRKYKSPDQMHSVIEAYFKACDAGKRKYSVEGLALSLGFSSTEGLREYGTGDNYEDFHDLIKMAKLKIQMQRVEDLQSGELNAIAGIFLLSNCHKTDYQRDPDSKNAGEYKVNSFLGEYVKPNEDPTDGETNNDETAADGEAG